MSLRPVVVDLDESFFDVDVRRSVLAHRPELHEMSVRRDVPHRVEDVQRPFDVVALGEDRVLARDHRVRRTRLLAVMNDGIGAEALEEVVHEVGIGQVSDEGLDRPSRDLGPRFGALLKGLDRRQGPGPQLDRHRPAREVVDDCHVVTGGGEVHGGGPPEVAVAAEDKDSHDGGKANLQATSSRKPSYVSKERLLPPELATSRRRRRSNSRANLRASPKWSV